MRYKAVCEELWSIASDAPSRILYREAHGRTRFVPLVGRQPGLLGNEMRRVHDKNNNSEPRSHARTHMGSLSHVPAGISLSVGHTRASRAPLRRRRAAVVPRSRA
jgi:hypothetical protein